MQLAYQFPERCGRLVLMSSGGIARDVHPLLRAASLPGSELVLPLITHERLLRVGQAIGRAIGLIGLQAGADIAEGARGYASLNDGEARSAFIHTIRAVIDPTGQRISALDRLYLAEDLPVLIVWGERDPIIPIAHGRAAHAQMPGSRLEVFPDIGHVPQLEAPGRFAAVLQRFLDDTEPAEFDGAAWRSRLSGR